MTVSHYHLLLFWFWKVDICSRFFHSISRWNEYSSLWKSPIIRRRNEKVCTGRYRGMEKTFSSHWKVRVRQSESKSECESETKWKKECIYEKWNNTIEFEIDNEIMFRVTEHEKWSDPQISHSICGLDPLQHAKQS